MNDLEVLDLLVAVEALDGYESDIRTFLLHKDKCELLSAVRQHGRSAVSDVTKDSTVLYSRDSRECTGADADFLHRLFLEERPTPSPGMLRYSGPEHILLIVMDHSYPGQAVIGSFSPFADRAAYQWPPQELADDPVVYGFRFSATMQLRNTLAVLQQHGRIERTRATTLPRVTDENWQGVWLAKTRPMAELVPGSRELPEGQMASDIGAIDRDGGDYLRFMLLAKRIMACPLSDTDKGNLIHRSASFSGEGGHSFDRFIDFHGGTDAFLRKLHR